MKSVLSKVLVPRSLAMPLLLVAILLVGCCGGCDDLLKIKCAVNYAGRVPVSDSIRFSFNVKNCAERDLSVRLMPECDCTVLDRENLTLPSGKKEKVTALVKIDAIGKFKKYIFIQLDDDRVFYTVELSGVAVESK